MLRFVLLYLSISLIIGIAVAAVPSYMQICGKRNPNLDQCIINSVNNLKDKLKSGIPEISAPALEPLFIDEIALANLSDFKAIAVDCKLNGLSDFITKYFHVDLKNQRFDMDIIFPKIYLDSGYLVDTKILVAVIKEKGRLQSVSRNTNSKVTMKYRLVERKGKTYMFLSSMSTKLTIDDYDAKYTSASGKKSAITEAIDSILLNNKKEIIESMIPNIELAVSKKILDISNKITKNFSYDELFPDRE